MSIFTVDDSGGSTVDVRNVPVFMTHNDRNYQCDTDWLDRCVADFWSQRMRSTQGGVGEQYAMLPPVTVGHTPESPDAEEPPSVGFVDNLRRIGQILYADFIGLHRKVFDQIKDGKYPYRSAEVIPSRHRLTNVSLLGGRYPHFALPIMRFSANGFERVRYVMEGDDMAAAASHVDRSFGAGAPGGMNMGMGGPAMGEGAEQMAMAQVVAPLVAKILAEKGANAMPVGEAAAYRDKKVERHEESDAGEHTDQTADAAAEDDPSVKSDEESVDFGTEEQGGDKEDFTGTRLNGDKMKLTGVSEDVKRYLHALENNVKELGGKLEQLTTANGNLQKHNIHQAQAAKRAMLTSKCKEIAALGYAIGDGDQIHRHVDRMMTMKTDDVKSYIEDILKQMPKIMTTVQRHGVSDYIDRPGAGTENERYVAENSELMEELGLDANVMDLADVLS